MVLSTMVIYSAIITIYAEPQTCWVGIVSTLAAFSPFSGQSLLSIYFFFLFRPFSINDHDDPLFHLDSGVPCDGNIKLLVMSFVDVNTNPLHPAYPSWGLLHSDVMFGSAILNMDMFYFIGWVIIWVVLL